MKSIVIAALLAFPAFGIVESVRETQLADAPHGFTGVFEHAARPRTGDEFLVRLDDGRPITIMQTGMRFFQPGERVIVIPDRQGARVEPADGHPPFQP